MTFHTSLESTVRWSLAHTRWLETDYEA
jgi:hypothetical protein